MPGAPNGQSSTLLVASTGGHLEELVRLHERFLPSSRDVTWVTFDDAQSRSLLSGKEVRFVRYVPPRGYRAAVFNLAEAFRILRGRRFDRVISTGAGIAVPFLAAGRALGLLCHYVESAARADGPSLTGAVVARLPGVHLHCQYPSWAAGRWTFPGSLFDSYLAERSERLGRREGPLRVVVTLGTMRTYGFPRAVRRLAALLPEVVGTEGEVLWQVGSTDVRGLPIAAHDLLPADFLREAITRADLVIGHAGVGSALTALDAGRCPVLLPRRKAHGEHVDDHQVMIAEDLQRRGLAVCRDADSFTVDDLVQATRITVTRVTSPEPFFLGTQ